MVIWRRKTSISSKRKRGFCGGSRDNIEHFIRDYTIIRRNGSMS